MNPESIDTLAPLWNIVIAIVVGVAGVVWAEVRQEKDDVQRLLDARRARALKGRDT